jgi:hypothetical protein
VTPPPHTHTHTLTHTHTHTYTHTYIHTHIHTHTHTHTLHTCGAQREQVTVSVDLTADELSFHDDDMTLRVVPGDYVMSAGGDSYSAGYLTAPLTLK